MIFYFWYKVLNLVGKKRYGCGTFKFLHWYWGLVSLLTTPNVTLCHPAVRGWSLSMTSSHKYKGYTSHFISFICSIFICSLFQIWGFYFRLRGLFWIPTSIKDHKGVFFIFFLFFRIVQKLKGYKATPLQTLNESPSPKFRGLHVLIL